MFNRHVSSLMQSVPAICAPNFSLISDTAISQDSKNKSGQSFHLYLNRKAILNNAIVLYRTHGE